MNAFMSYRKKNKESGAAEDFIDDVVVHGDGGEVLMIKNETCGRRY